MTWVPAALLDDLPEYVGGLFQHPFATQDQALAEFAVVVGTVHGIPLYSTEGKCKSTDLECNRQLCYFENTFNPIVYINQTVWRAPFRGTQKSPPGRDPAGFLRLPFSVVASGAAP
jgi:hypothetical protein